MAQEIKVNSSNPLEPDTSLKAPTNVQDVDTEAHPQSTIFAVDSAVTKAEKIERHAGNDNEFQESPTKRIKTHPSSNEEVDRDPLIKTERRKGVAPIKSESVI